MGLFLVFLIPVYYALGDFIDQRHLSKLIGSRLFSQFRGMVPLHVALPERNPIPWVILITIPVVKTLMRWCQQWKRRKQA